MKTSVLPFIPGYTFYSTQLDSCFVFFLRGRRSYAIGIYICITDPPSPQTGFSYGQVNIHDLLFKTYSLWFRGRLFFLYCDKPALVPISVKSAFIFCFVDVYPLCAFNVSLFFLQVPLFLLPSHLTCKCESCLIIILWGEHTLISGKHP